MNIRSLEAEIKKLTNLADQQDASDYYCDRDNDGNLEVQFYDNTIEHLPMFPFRPYQMEVQNKLFTEGISRFFLVRPRRSGKEVESWNMLVQGAIEAPGLYMMIYPTNVRARIVLWEGSIILSDGSAFKFLDMIPKRLVAGINNQDMSVKLINGSIIRVIGSDIDPDKLRGVNVRGCVFSEYAFSDPRVLHILMPVFRQNRGWFILQTTFNGMNHAYRFMLEIKNNPDWYCRVDSVESLVDEKGERYVTDAMIEDDRRSGMPEFMIQQEYYSVVQLNLETLYFANEMNVINNENRIQPGLILPNRKVRGFMDIGIRDPASLLLAQMDTSGKPHIVAYYENNNKPFEYYVRLAESFCTQHGLMFDSIYSPHDGQKREFGSGKNIVDFGRDLGYRVYIVPRPVSKFNAIQSMRRLLYRTYFNKDTTQRLLDCISNYSKEYDTKMGMFKEEPRHDWASHGCFTGETEVLTRFGHCAIMNLPNSGEVLTSCGWKQYTNPRITRKNAQLVKVVFKNGYTVKCTPDHLFKTVNGWKSAESLMKHIMIQSFSTKSHNILTGIFIEYGKNKAIIQKVAQRFTEMLGVWPLARYLKDVIFTILIATKQIIQFLIWNVCPQKNICQQTGMLLSICDLEGFQKKLMKRHDNGINQMKVDCGIADLPEELKIGQNGKEKKSLASIAVKKWMRLLEKVGMLKNTAPRFADLTIDHVEKLNEKQDVWCLTVPDIGEFSLANGAIVHNCDSYQTMTLAIDGNMLNERSTEVVYINPQ